VLLRSRALEASVERCLACRVGGDAEAAALAAALGGALAPASPAPGLVAAAVTRLARLLGGGDGLQARSCFQSAPELLSMPAHDRAALQALLRVACLRPLILSTKCNVSGVRCSSVAPCCAT
jgi:hypothetical protein